ncbi:HNH endonuclease domain-containing protein [Streptomyces sp. NPDC059385]|uniref:HNH endonuclease domain-containing protein n=1 Tax=Streptomyces sp. NPDC059385 TaxID=3346817 RepID=UPI0036CA08FC
MTEQRLPADDWRRSVYGRSVISGIQTRKRPRLPEQRRIQASQGSRCLYCELPIGTPIRRRSAVVILRTNWDHFIPYAYSQQNPSNNWVLACHVCNGIKTARMFADVESARKAILPERVAKGYESPDDVFHRLSLGRTLRPHQKRTRARSVVPRPTDRQLQALQLAAYGMRPGQIARELGVASSQGSVLVQEAARCMGTAARHRAIEIAIENGFINPPDPETEP